MCNSDLGPVSLKAIVDLVYTSLSPAEVNFIRDYEPKQKELMALIKVWFAGGQDDEGEMSIEQSEESEQI